MSNEATSLVTCAMPVPLYTYERVRTIEAVAAAVEQTVSTCFKQQCGLVTVSFQFQHGYEKASERNAQQSTHYYLNELRKLVRKTDSIFVLDSTLFFLLQGANAEGGRIVENRLWDALLWCVHSVTEENALRPFSMAIGHSAYIAGEGDAIESITSASVPCYSLDIQPASSQGKRQTQLPEKSVASTSEGTDTGDKELTSLARRLGVPYLSLLPRKKPEQVRRFVPLKLAHELQCYPIGRERGTLTVALVNPQDSTVLERLREETGLRIFPVLTHPKEMQTALSFLV